MNYKNSKLSGRVWQSVKKEFTERNIYLFIALTGLFVTSNLLVTSLLLGWTLHRSPLLLILFSGFLFLTIAFVRSSVRIVALILLVIGILIGVNGYIRQYGIFDFDWLYKEFYANFSTELISISITVLIIDSISEWRQNKRVQINLRQQLVREIGSKDNGIALRAINELRAKDWLTDGSLVGAQMPYANIDNGELKQAQLRGVNLYKALARRAYLETANLSSADLKKADFTGSFLKHANLEHANLTKAKLVNTWLDDAALTGAFLQGADLRGASVSSEQLSTAASLDGAIMPNGFIYEEWLLQEQGKRDEVSRIDLGGKTSNEFSEQNSSTMGSEEVDGDNSEFLIRYLMPISVLITGLIIGRFWQKSNR